MIGRTISHYRVLEKIGEGGMGEVYRAADTRLGRDVALKFLPQALANDFERVARLEREAQLLASLNHPNIAAIHGFEEADGFRFLILELVPGETLAERIAVGAVELPEALRIAVQIAEALEAAHEKGVIHRDLKPANIKITPAGRVKVLDFGLAKAFAPDSAVRDPGESPTISAIATRGGAILGTAAYMSPEQARGKPLDKRTDIWSFGCVLFEMLTARRPFQGETTTDVLSALLSQGPEWSRLPASTPPRIQEMLQRCLEKDASRRLRDIGDARLEIEAATEALGKPAAATPQTAAAQLVPRRTLFWAAVVVLVLVTGVAGWVVRGRWSRGGEPAPVRISRLTDFVGLEQFPAISPDGKAVAFTADVDGERQIWVRLLAGGAPLELTHDGAEHLYPRWARDSASLTYFTPSDTPDAQGTLWEISALGGAPRRIAGSIAGGDISHDDKRMAFFRASGGQVELVVAARDGTNVSVLARLPATFAYDNPQWSPDDQWVAYRRGWVFSYDIFRVAANGGEPQQVTHDSVQNNGFAWLPDGSGVIYSSAKGSTNLYLPVMNLWAAHTDGSRPRQLTFGETSYLAPDVDAQGRVAAARQNIHMDIWRFPVDGSPAENVRRGVPITRQTGQVLTPSVSPDDREIVFLSDSGGHGNLWVIGADGKGLRQITNERDPRVAVGVPVWSPDGKYIAYVLRQPGSWNVDMWLVNPDGSNPHAVAQQVGWATWSLDGRWLYYSGRNLETGAWQMEKLNVETGQKVKLRPDDAYGLSISRDGSTVYFVKTLANANGMADVEIQAAPLEAGPARVLARISGARIPRWQMVHPILSPDDKWLALPLNTGPVTNIWAVPTAGGPMRQLTDFAPRRTFIVRRVSWFSDGRFIVASVGDGDADIVLLEGLLSGEIRK